ncbi:flagellar FlbD family protein [Clostridium saccharoperbutylacetonicum]|uniref:Flagellar protein FlbD n=1 Tax=Clostridium saccharoperbutylacetonicum N1-4(HMT) TaxID=931276 RepID=M1MUC7_9CLOT|nr:flagellar FlbD family protein [Clostridium saccharoperbutylacetonicum]AGF58266.1 flagellar protein FlbD [Clostridium saccharoperbutylacetonicum N1-4(HMT)]NRT60957.1 flagellar protein FlbD [Clostridium saccharoperbutylacetonicum]NSB24270.1 flagellar protein FlbD [Clostridium saccharoperbutylacetonicum]NSB43648.1 flagellar protein FlbD [Clostridium saccharoperbutylacetonicum]
MINVTGMNHEKFVLNADHIEKIEEVPETIITLTNGRKYIVLESIDEVRNAVMVYKNKIFTLKV